MRQYVIILCCSCLLFVGCEDTDIRLATEAGIEAVKAITLSDEEVLNLARQSAAYIDGRYPAARVGNRYAERLDRLVGNHLREKDLLFNYKVYIVPEVNAFAMADGTIRIYSGLMDLLDDGELRFVIGHEMGHVVMKHIRKKMQIAYAAGAIRKGIASQNNVAGNIVRSQLGGFVEMVLGAQFSQFEEKEADDYGLSFLAREGYEPGKGVSALEKLASLGNDHSFLSTHPAPAERAIRIQNQLEGKSLSIEESRKSIFTKAVSFLARNFPILYERVKDCLPQNF